MEKIEIPTGLYNYRLLSFLYPLKFSSTEEKKAIEVLHKICSIDLTDSHDTFWIKKLELTGEEKQVVLFNGWHLSDNKEVKACCNDVLCRFEKDKRAMKTFASEYYLDAYKESGESQLLVRAITIRDIKQINTEDFLESVLSLVYITDIYPFWIHRIIESLLKSYPVEKIKKILPYIQERHKQALNENNFIDDRKYIELYYSLKELDKEELHKSLALSYESEGDHIVTNKQPNTIYPTLPDIYQNAFEEIYKVKIKEPEIYNRIKNKLIEQKRTFVEFLSTHGVKIKLELSPEFIQPIEEHLKNETLENFIQTIALLRTIPFVTEKQISRYKAAARKSGILSDLFGTDRLGSKGNTVGFAKPDNSLTTEAHIYFRQQRLYTLWSYYKLHQWSKIPTDESLLYFCLEKYKPDYIDEQWLSFWTKGFWAALNGDFISASHILMPQLEHVLHNIVEIRKGNISTLEKKRQEVPTLGTILPMLKGVFKEEVRFEIESFLQSGIDANFRNNLLHGLLTPFEVKRDGIYLFWICLKIYFEEECFLL